MTSNIFDEVRWLVPARSVAAHYGFQPNRAGYICCPFHNEKSPSLKLYDSGRWHCFGCNSGGSSIDFVMRLFDLSLMDAVRRMNTDFNLSLPLDKPPTAAQQKAAQQRQELLNGSKKYEEWRTDFIEKLNAAYRIGYIALRDLTSLDDLSEGEALGIQWLDSLEHWSNCLSYGTMAEQIIVFRGRRGIAALCNQVMNRSQMKSRVA